MSFRDRHDAGWHLADTLKDVARIAPFERPVVVALPRGGVPVSFEVARALGAALDVLIVRKIGALGHPELGLGVVVDGLPPQVVLSQSVMDLVRPSKVHLEAETRRQVEELERQREAYVGTRSLLDASGRTAILVDDGIATGGTVRAALEGLARAGATGLVLAVPVAPLDTLVRLREDADEVICLKTLDPFRAVGLHYNDFRQTTDQEVIDLLRAAQEFPSTGA